MLSMLPEVLKMPNQRNDRMREIFADEIRFVREGLGHDPWDTQEAILRSVFRNRRTAVKSCHASSKSFGAAEAALAWVSRWRDAKVLVTAPGQRQVRSVVWSEIHRAIRNAKIRFPVQPNQTELRFSESNFIMGLTASEGVAFQGFHGGHVLVIIDEAPGVDGEIWEAIEGIAAGGNTHILALGNPVIPSGPFYDAFTRNRAQWSTFTIDAFATPNLKGLSVDDLLALPDDQLDENPRPYLVTRRWVREKFNAWWNGSPETSPLWQSRVRGEFPSQSENSLLALAWLEHARRPVPEGGDVSVTAGVDVAGPGSDKTVATIVGNGGILATKAWHNPDPRGEVIYFLQDWRSRLRTVRVDATGIGYNFALHLRDERFDVQMINAGSAPTDENERFKNLKAQLYWQLRERFKAGEISGLGDEALAELAAIRYSIDPRGKIEIEGKDELRKRIGRSPDYAESLMLAISPSFHFDIEFQRQAATVIHSAYVARNNRTIENRLFANGRSVCELEDREAARSSRDRFRGF
jgi:phage terminase large subunit